MRENASVLFFDLRKLRHLAKSWPPIAQEPVNTLNVGLKKSRVSTGNLFNLSTFTDSWSRLLLPIRTFKNSLQNVFHFTAFATSATTEESAANEAAAATSSEDREELGRRERTEQPAATATAVPETAECRLATAGSYCCCAWFMVMFLCCCDVQREIMVQKY